MFNHQELLLKISTPFLLLLLHISAAAADCSCDTAAAGKNSHHNRALKLKLGAIAAILVAGAAGVTLPLLAKRVPSLRPDSDAFFVIKAFAAGVILATGFVHILPDAFERLASPCIRSSPWADFPFTGLISMAAAIGALIIDASATGVYRKKHFGKQVVDAADEERGGGRGEHAGHVHVHTHATHGHAHGSADPDGPEIGGLPDLVRHRIISQVLEIGIVVHSVIIGISLGVSGSPKTIKPLLGALSFHQFFEGMGLGGCISQAKFESRPMAIMATCFSLTTPVGVAIGIAIASVYEEHSSTALIVEGALNSASAGILVYMALVDLLAADFMNPRLQSNGRLFSCASVFLFLGTGLMSLLAIWA